MERIARNWLPKVGVFAAIALALRGFLARIVEPIGAAMDASIDPAAVSGAEIVLLALYTLGLFAFPSAFWRRAFKFVCLMTAYMLLSPFLVAGLAAVGLSGAAAHAAVAAVAGHALALVVGFLAYKLAWPGLKAWQPHYNPAA